MQSKFNVYSHRAHYPNIAIRDTSQSPKAQSLPEGGRETKAQTRDCCSAKTDEDDRLSACSWAVRHAAPEHSSQELSRREGGSEGAGLNRDGGVG